MQTIQLSSKQDETLSPHRYPKKNKRAQSQNLWQSTRKQPQHDPQGGFPRTRPNHSSPLRGTPLFHRLSRQDVWQRAVGARHLGLRIREAGHPRRHSPRPRNLDRVRAPAVHLHNLVRHVRLPVRFRNLPHLAHTLDARRVVKDRVVAVEMLAKEVEAEAVDVAAGNAPAAPAAAGDMRRAVRLRLMVASV